MDRLVIMLIVMHLAPSFQGLFPWCGQILLGRPAAYGVALAIVLLGILVYGTIQLKMWACWGSVAYVALLSLSTIWTLAGRRVADILPMWALPASETRFLSRLTLWQEVYPVGLLAPRLLIALGLIVYSRRYFGQSG